MKTKPLPGDNAVGLLFCQFMLYSRLHSYIFLCCLLLFGTFHQIGVGNDVNQEELMGVASEPHELNIYLPSRFSSLNQNLADRLANVLCNSKHNSIHDTLLCVPILVGLRSVLDIGWFKTWVTVTVTVNGLVKLLAFNAHICPSKYLVYF